MKNYISFFLDFKILPIKKFGSAARVACRMKAQYRRKKKSIFACKRMRFFFTVVVNYFFLGPETWNTGRSEASPEKHPFFNSGIKCIYYVLTQ
jgi:hypothetical protein